MILPQNFQIRGNYALVYTDRSYLPRRFNPKNILDNFKGNEAYSGQITSSSAKRIRKAVSVFVQRSDKKTIFNTVTSKYQDFKIGFLTLTIPDLTSNNNSFYYKCLLKPFLRKLKDKYQVSDYIWKAEVQKRGSIHYHLTINQFVPYTYLRDSWNELLNKNGLMNSYISKYGNVSPNSIDIHSVINIDNIEGYLSKYISKKQDNGTKLIGKVWGCSESIQGVGYFSKVLGYEMEILINKLENQKKIIVKSFDQFSIIRFVGKVNWWLFGTILNDDYSNWRSNRLVLKI